MNNRWGKPIDPKSGLKSSGQNHINININFNAVRQKTNAFTGKKIDNYIQVNNSPKNIGNRPNVSMQTLKQKKKKQAVPGQYKDEYKMVRKKSRSKIIAGLQTPQKQHRQFFHGDDKSINKKSTQKRNSKSHEKYRNIQQKKSSKQKSYSNSNSRSKSRSASHSQSGKKYIKNQNSSSSNFPKNFKKIPTKGLTRPQTADVYSKNSQKQIKQGKIQKTRKTTRKGEKQENGMKRKKSEDCFSKKKVIGIQQNKKNSDDTKKTSLNSKALKSRKISQSTKSLKPLPLVIGDDDDSYQENSSNNKFREQTNQLAFEQKRYHKKLHHQQTSHKKKHKKQSIISRYMAQAHTYQDVKKLTEVAKTIQRFWRGYKVRSQFVNQLNLMHHKIQISRKKIADIDPKFWDGASDSILHAEDPESIAESASVDNQSEHQKNQVSQTSSVRQKLKKNRVVDSNISEQLLERMNKLEQDLKEQREKAKKLEQENNNLKQNLQKVSGLQSLQSGNPSFQSSLKQSITDSWQEVKPSKNIKKDQYKQQKYKPSQSEEDSQQFQLRLPQRINQKKQKKQKKQFTQVKNQLEKYKEKMQLFECSSPKHVTFTIDNSLMQLFNRKQMQLKQTYERKSTMYERMYHDKLFSPRTYSFKKNQLEDIMKKQTEKIKNRLQEAQRVAVYLKQMEQQQKSGKKDPKKQQQKQTNHLHLQSPKNIISQQQKFSNVKIEQLSEIKPQPQENSQQKPQQKLETRHIVENYENIDLHSHRSKPQIKEDSNFQIKNQDEKKRQNAIKQIQSQNQNAIRIFQRVSEHIQEDQEEMEAHGQEYSEGNQIQHEQNAALPPDEEEERQIRPKGMETTLLFIKQYCVSFVEYIRASEHKHTFIEGVCSPIQYNTFQYLKNYRTTILNDYQNSYNSHESEYLYPFFKLFFPRSQVITREAFQDFNQIYEKLHVQCDFPIQRDYFLVSLLDAFNQSLDYQRPGSIYGKPPAWISQFRNLKNNSLIAHSQHERDQIFVTKFDEACGVAIARVIQWATCLCGFIPQSPEMGDVQIGQEQINQIHESRMALMLEKDLLENEENILDSYAQQTEVKLYLSEEIFKLLLLQLVRECDFFK